MTEVKTAIKTLAGKAEKAPDATDALKFSQAALNLTHILSVKKGVDKK